MAIYLFAWIPKESDFFTTGYEKPVSSRGKQNKEIKGRGLKRSLRATRPVLPDKDLESGPGVHHPGFTAESQRISRTAGMTEGRSLYLLKPVPRILPQTCCLSTSYMLVGVSAYRKGGQKNGGVGYNAPLLHTQGSTQTHVYARLSLAPVLLANLLRISDTLLSAR